MNYWNILGVEKTNDVRAIKRAYAVKLKKTKPDEDPEGFKKLHEAYKWATNYAKNNYEEEAEFVDPVQGEYQFGQINQPVNTVSLSPINEEHILNPVEASFNSQNSTEFFRSEQDSTQETEPVSENIESKSIYPSVSEFFIPEHDVVDSDNPVQVIEQEKTESSSEQVNELFEYIEPHSHQEAFTYEGIDDEFSFLQQQWDELTDQVDNVTRAVRTINNLRSWRFIEGNQALLDLQFKSEFSHYLFGKIVECLEKEKVSRPISRNVFQYLNSIFRWTDRRDYLEDEFDFDSVEKVLYAESVIEERGVKWFVSKIHKGKMEYAGYFTRLIATVFDWIILTFILMFLHKIQIDPFGMRDGNIGVAFFIAILLYVLVSSLLEATPLQGSLGKILFGMKVVSPSGKRLNILHSIFRGFMFGITLAAFKITVWINFFLKDGRLLHDRVSGSIVVKR